MMQRRDPHRPAPLCNFIRVRPMSRHDLFNHSARFQKFINSHRSFFSFFHMRVPHKSATSLQIKQQPAKKQTSTNIKQKVVSRRSFFQIRNGINGYDILNIQNPESSQKKQIPKRKHDYLRRRKIEPVKIIKRQSQSYLEEISAWKV